jgi:NAD(P) transhydrogenase subunit alpha
MMTTAAGTTKAAKAMILGVGVAGLQAIATMRRLGADVEAFDIRPEVADQVRSLGATWIEATDDEDDDDGDEEDEREPTASKKFSGGMRALFGLPERSEEEETPEEPAQNGDSPSEDDEGDDGEDDEESTGGYAQEQSEEKQKADQELVNERIAEMDVVLTTALVPGKKAPTLVTEDMVKSMKPGSVLVDLAAEAGGNCELSEAGEVVVREQVTIVGPTDVASSMPIHASQLLSRNMASLLDHLVEKEEPEGDSDDSDDDEDNDGDEEEAKIKLELDFEDEITDEACVTHDGEVRQERVREALESSEKS